VIVDTLQYVDLYRAICPRLGKALAWLRDVDAAALPDGKHEIDGTDIFAIVSGYTTHDPATKPYEAHRSYLDIQFLVSGAESLYWCPVAWLQETQAYAAAKDVAFYEGAGGMAVPLRAGAFAILFPQDAHKPGCTGERPEAVRKIVVKVRIG
jgi:YhcH/YjgK/YiaL family protein